MTRQEFHTVDVLRLEVENDPPPGAVRNTVPNPDGKLGGWGWLSPVEDTVVTGDPAHPNTLLMRTNVAQSGVYFTTEPIPAKAGATHTSMGFGRDSGVSTVGVSGRVDFLDAAGALISSTASTSVLTGTNVSASLLSQAIPAGTAYLQIRLALTRGGASALNASDSVNVEAVELYQGTAGELAVPTIENGWTDILGPTHEITVERVELDLGVLTASIRDASLDPSQADTIRTGKPIRLRIPGGGAVPGIGTLGELLFAGTIRNAQVSYDLAHPDANKRAQISLSAVDQAQPLANTTRPDGMAAVGELPAVFEGCGVPWNVNGNNGHTATTPVVVSRNENASAMDQVAITRDSNHAYAWFSREGVVNVWDAATLAASGPPVWGTPLDENAYNPGISMDYDTDRCINHVTLKYLRIDPVTGETEEVTYGPYTDDASRARWGTHAAEFTVHGITEDAATLAAYAAEILVANATPAVRINEVTVPINRLADITEWAVRDLYDLVTLTPPTGTP